MADWSIRHVVNVGVAKIRNRNKHVLADLQMHVEEPTAGTLAAELALTQDPNAKRQEEKRLEIHDNFIGKVSTSKTFEYTTLSIIVLNALMIGWDADYTARWKKPAVNVLGIEYEGPWYFVMIDWMFATYFVSEIAIRFLAYRRKSSCCKSGWFVFDSILVAMMVSDTWILPLAGLGNAMAKLSSLRLVRLIRVTRLIRLMRAFPEMMMLINGMFAAFRAVSWVGVLLFLICFTFSIMFTNEFHQGPLADEDVELPIQIHFGSMGKCMFTLFFLGSILDDVTVACDAIRTTGNNMMLLLFILFIVISSFMMLNLLVGIMAEVVMSSADAEKAGMRAVTIRGAILTVLMKLDNDASGMITKSEYFQMRGHVELKLALDELDVKEKHFYMFAELLFKEPEEGSAEALSGKEPELSVEEVIELILQLRPGNSLSTLDFAAMATDMNKSRTKVENWVVKIERQVEEVMRLRKISPRPLTAPTLAHTNTRPSRRQSEERSSLHIQERVPVDVNLPGAVGNDLAPVRQASKDSTFSNGKGIPKHNQKGKGDGDLRAAGTGDFPMPQSFAKTPHGKQPEPAPMKIDERFRGRAGAGVDNEMILRELQRRLAANPRPLGPCDDLGRCLTTGTAVSASIVEISDIPQELYDVETTESEGFRDPFVGSRLSSDDFEEMSC